MTWRTFFKPATLLFVVLWLVLLVGGQSRFFRDPGTFWHTVVGQEIIDGDGGHTSRGFFDTEEYTFTFAGKKWIPYEWLGEVLMAAIHRIDGFDSLLLATATILAALFTWLGVRLMRCGLHPSLAMVLVALGVAASSGHFHVRPLVATISGFAVTMAFLCDCEAKRISFGRLAWLVPIFWVWSNIHGGSLGGLATFALAIFGWTVAWKIGWDSPISTYRQMLLLGLIWLGCAATAFISPYGASLPEAWWDVMRMQSLPLLIREHAPINLQERNAWMILLFGLIYLALLSTTFPRKPRIVWLLPLIWFVMACMRIRHAPLFAVGALVAIADLFPCTRIAYNLEAKGSDLFESPPSHPDPKQFGEKLAPFVIPICLVLVALFLQIERIEVPVIGHGWAKLDPDVWPVELLDELQARQNDRPGGTHIFNEYAYGGFLIYYTPGYRVFVDDRCEVFGDVWLSEFVNASRPERDEKIPDWHARMKERIDTWQKRYGQFDYSLVSAEPGFGFIVYFENNPEWDLVKQTKTAALFKRKTSKSSP
jgi:hypothetical protein